MIAEVLGLRPGSLRRWLRREAHRQPAPRRRRPGAISPEVRARLRKRYLDSLRQWGPAVLACWARREGLGSYCPTTIARAIEDLRPEPDPPARNRTWVVKAPGVMWSEDGAAFRQRGRKHELLLVQDEHSRFKVGHQLVRGPAKGADVRKALEAAIAEHGAPLVLKRDGGAIFDERSVMELLDAHGVIVITSPPGYPKYNGRMERAVRDVRSHERAQRQQSPPRPLADRIAVAIDDLNDHRPRPVLGGATAREVYTANGVRLPGRDQFRKEVFERETVLVADAASRHERDAARRRAVEDVLQWHGLMRYTGCVSTNSAAPTRTT